MTDKEKKTLKGWKEVLLLILGLILGVWLYDLYSEGGLGLMLAQGWIGLLVALLLATVIWWWDRIVRLVKR